MFTKYLHTPLLSLPLRNAFNNPFLKIFYVIALSNQRLAHFLNARVSCEDTSSIMHLMFLMTFYVN